MEALFHFPARLSGRIVGGTKRLMSGTLLQRYRRCRQVRESLGDDFDKLRPQEITRLLGVAEDEFQMRLPGA